MRLRSYVCNCHVLSTNNTLSGLSWTKFRLNYFRSSSESFANFIYSLIYLLFLTAGIMRIKVVWFFNLAKNYDDPKYL